MKKLKWIGLTIVILAAIILRLYYNKQKINENAQMSIEKHTEIPVVVVKPVQIQSTDTLFYTGTLEADKSVTILCEGQGEVKELKFDIGSTVKTGQVLVKLEDKVLRSQLELAKTTYDKALKDRQRFENLIASNAATPNDLESANLAFYNTKATLQSIQKQLDNTEIIAPFAGTITKKQTEKGSILMPGSPIAEISNVNLLKTKVMLTEFDINKIKTGQTVNIKVDAEQDVALQGKITAISPKADDSKRYEVEVTVVSKPNSIIKAGMFVRIILQDKTQRTVWSLPRKALVGSIKDPKVYLIRDQKAHLIPIQLYRATHNTIEILGGVTADEQIVTSGQINLEEGVQVEIVK